MTTLVIGATGSVGGAVLTGLVGAGSRVRASSRSPRPGGFPPGVDVVRADLHDPSTFPRLLVGIRTVFLYADATEIDAFTRAAVDAGVEHVVLLSSNSVLFPGAADNPVAVEHMRVEAAIRRSGLAWTFVRPGYLATNTFRWRTSIRRDRVVRTAFPEGTTRLVHERDVAEVAVAAVLDARWRGSTPLVLGGEPLTEREQVATIADALGEPVTVDVLSVDEYRRELTATMPSVFVEPVIASRGMVPEVPDDVRVDATRDVLGRDPLPFAVWASDHAADFRGERSTGGTIEAAGPAGGV